MGNSRIGTQKAQKNLEHVIVPESEGALRKQKDGGISEGHRSQSERNSNGQYWNNLCKKISTGL